MPVRTTPQRIQLPTGGSQGATGSDQIQQQLAQIQGIPGLDEVEGLLGSNLDGLGGATAAQFFQNLARTASAQQGGQRLGLGVDVDVDVDDEQFLALAGRNDNVNPFAQNSLARPRRIGDSNSIDALLLDLADGGGGGAYFEDRIFTIMCKVVEDMQRKIEERLQKLQASAEKAEADAKEDKESGGSGAAEGGESRNIEFEKIKFDMQKLSQMQQAMSNVLNTMDELAKSAIRNIKV